MPKALNDTIESSVNGKIGSSRNNMSSETIYCLDSVWNGSDKLEIQALLTHINL